MMEEERPKKEEQPKKESAPDDETKQSLIEKADALAKRLEAENERGEALAKKNEELAARLTLGGRSEAGQQPQEKKEETPSEYVDRVLRDGKA